MFKISVFFLLFISLNAFSATNNKANIKKIADKLGMQTKKINWLNSIKMYEVDSRANSSIYFDKKGKNFFVGTWYAMENGKPVNKSRERFRKTIKLVLSSAKKKDLIIYPATTKEIDVLYVFTDVNCQYCKKLHAEIPELNKMGISVYYLASPVISKTSRQDMINIWCSKNKKAALDRAENNNIMSPFAKCNHPVDKHLKIARSLGVNATPYLVLKSIYMPIAGYTSAKNILRIHLTKGEQE
jgi:thiol:disulfide interchange protein DsbC